MFNIHDIHHRFFGTTFSEFSETVIKICHYDSVIPRLKDLCPKTCDQRCHAAVQPGCYDLSPSCTPWLNNCHTRPIATLCRKSCGVCTDPVTTQTPISVHPDNCHDQLAICSKWNQNCHIRNIQQLCPVTCNICSTTTTTTTTTSTTTTTTTTAIARDPCVNFADDSMCAFVYSNGFCSVVGVREQCAGSCNMCAIEQAALAAPSEDEFKTTEAVTVATITLAAPARAPQKCSANIYCSVFADQCTTSKRIRLMCPEICGLCDSNGYLTHPDSETIVDEVLETIRADNNVQCGVDNYNSCVTWKDHCDLDYIRVQCSSTCDYCPEVVPEVAVEPVTVPPTTTLEPVTESPEGVSEADVTDDGCSDVDPNCTKYHEEGHCNLEVIQTLCPTTCEVGPCGIVPDTAEFGSADGSGYGSGYGSGDGSGDFEIEMTVDSSDIPDNVPIACRPGGEMVDVGQGQGQIKFGAPQDLPYEYHMCEYHIQNPENDDMVLLDFYEIFDIRTDQDCMFYVEVYSGHVPIVRLCGNGNHAPVAGKDLKIRVEAYGGYGFNVDVSSISDEGFEIIQTASDEKYHTRATTHALRIDCKDEPYCAALRDVCTDDLVSSRCPVTCGRCHPLEEVIIYCPIILCLSETIILTIL